MAFWKRLSTKTLFTHPRHTVVEDEVELPNGERTMYLRFENVADYVTVIARVAGKLAFVREYAYPLNAKLLQFPEGVLGASEDVIVGARRELQEETGLASDTCRVVGRSPHSHRRDDASQHIVVADEAYGVVKSGGDAEEQGIELVWIPEAEVGALIASGKITQKNTLAAWAIFSAVVKR